jgi:hypothetical protein
MCALLWPIFDLIFWAQLRLAQIGLSGRSTGYGGDVLSQAPNAIYSFRQRLFRNLVVIVVATAAFFAWNYITNLHGPR